MHPNFTFPQILWTASFASQLVLLVVLMGRDRIRRFPLFTASMTLFTLRLLIEELLSGRLPMITLQSVLIPVADLGAVLGLLVVVEIARRGFAGASRQTWLATASGLTAVSAIALYLLGRPWPAPVELAVDSPLALLRLLQFLGQKANLFVSVLTVTLFLLVVFFGRSFKAGWRSHSTLILTGLTAIAAAWLGIIGYWQHLTSGLHAGITRAEYQQILALGSKLFNGNKILYVVVVIWWIAVLWFDEPGSTPALAVGSPMVEAPAATDESPSEEVERQD
jgi:hypothetical protein